MTDIQTLDWLEIGRVVAPHSLDGSLRIYPSSDFPERFLEPGDRWLRKVGQVIPERISLLSGRYLQNKGLYVIKIAGITDRDQAEALRDARLLVPQSDRLPVEPNEFHVADLIGLQARLKATGSIIGTIVDVYSAGNDILAIQLNNNRDNSSLESKRSTSLAKSLDETASVYKDPVLVPFVYEIVPVVNLEAGYVEIEPPKGLLPDL